MFAQLATVEDTQLSELMASAFSNAMQVRAALGGVGCAGVGRSGGGRTRDLNLFLLQSCS